MIVTWSNWLDGYEVYGAVQSQHPNVLKEMIDSGVVVNFYQQFLASLYTIFYQVFFMLPTIIEICIFFGLWYLIVDPLLKRLSLFGR
jgi:hypothetical protein